ncbi:hypothetical protein LWI28_025708 [Acer negundo]|uniref:Pectinesterase n=1 Tax=Acer negundo TaxID=4023 RepID=A0AAD5J270_ACENE|nr:hypothetical protein LWI28_025708 [Acer negundo]
MQPYQPFSFFLLLLLLFFSGVCRAFDFESDESDQNQLTYTITVDQSGKGNFTNIQSAIDKIPDNNGAWKRIQISPGKYREKITIPLNKPYIFLKGAGSKSTFVEWSDHDETDTSSTFSCFSNNILVKGITFKNTYDVSIGIDQNQVTQALAARIYGDKSAFYDCGFTGLQDTLWDVQGRHYFKDCYIEGAIDFIFGSGQSIYEQFEIHLSMGAYAEQYATGYITAQGRNSSTDPSAFVFKTCNITGTNGKAYLGRACGGYSRVIFADSTIADIIVPEGWDAWNYIHKEENIEYLESGCSGSGADASKRVSWEKKVTDPAYLNHFVDISFIDKIGWISKLPS